MKLTPLLIYREMAPQLRDATTTGYHGGLATMVKLNKKKILRLAEPLFKISYTGADQLILKNFEVEAFTVAGVLQFEAEEKLKAIAKSILDGTHPLLQKHPESDVKALWRDEAYNILADYIDIPDFPPPGILQTNLQTATNSSYHAAQWQRLRGLQDVYPAYQYMTRNDDRVREEHAILHEKVFAASDPAWNAIWPPNGWNCRCYINPLTDEEIAQVAPGLRVALTDTDQRDSLVKQAEIAPEFKRNSGQTESIWGKWLRAKMKEIDFTNVSSRMKTYADDLGLKEEIWGEFITSGKTVKIIIQKSEVGSQTSEKILIKIDDKEIEDDISNIDKYRRGVLLNAT
jgi:SPP1 gp7 family putative phage head morphogenesis protein